MDKLKLKLRISKNIIIMFVFLIIYKLSLDISYKNFVYVEYAYAGFDYNFDILKYVEATLLMIIIFIVTPKRRCNLSTVFLQIQYLVMIMPMLVIYSYMNYSRTFLYATLLCHIIQVAVLNKNLVYSRKNLRGCTKIVKLVGPLFILVTIAVSIVYNGIPSLKALNVLSVYEIRSEINMPFGFGYIINWVCKIMIPFGVAYYWFKKKYWYVGFLFICQLILYLIYAHKTFLFMIFMVLGVLIILNKKEKQFTTWMYVGMAGVVVVSYLVYILYDDIIVSSLFIRRTLFVPAQLKNEYFNFYSAGPKNWFAYGFIGKIMLLFGIKPNYPYTTSTMIATYMNGEFWTGANTGYMGDAYAQGGFIMMILFSLLLVLIIRLIERNSDSLDNKIVIASSIYIFFTLNDGALLTTILTGGLWLYVVLVYLFNSDAAKMQNYRIKEINIK